jgi:hypothetical protein
MVGARLAASWQVGTFFERKGNVETLVIVFAKVGQWAVSTGIAVEREKQGAGRALLFCFYGHM